MLRAIEELSIGDFRSVVLQMRERRTGTIINLSSVAGTFSHPPATPYCASKWALEALSEGLVFE